MRYTLGYLTPMLAGAILGFLPASSHAAPALIQIFPFPQPIRYDHHNDDFTVRVRVPGGEWQDLYEYNAKVDWDKPQDASMVYFNFTGTVEVAVQKNNGTFQTVAIRPTSKGIKSTVRDGIVYFTLNKPENLSVEFDGDHLHNLHLFSQAIRPEMPRAATEVSSYAITTGTAPDLTQPVITFGPGVHTPSDGKGWEIPSNSTVYIDGSALLKGHLLLKGVENVKIISNGLFDGTDTVQIKDSRNILVDGPISINQPHGTMGCVSSQHVKITNVRTIGGGQWSDGIANYSCQDVEISHVFVRTSDDCIPIYNHRGDHWGDTRNIIIKDSTLWADVAHAINMGIHGNTPSPEHPDPEVLEHVRVKNVDVLDTDEDEGEYEGVIGITAGDHNLVRDIIFEDIRVERIEEGKLFNFHVGYNAKYNTSPGRGIEDVTLRNVTFSGRGSPSASVIFGYSPENGVKDIHLENVTIAGKKILAPQPGILDIGDHVTGVTYK